jgi:hypothetical protein
MHAGFLVNYKCPRPSRVDGIVYRTGYYSLRNDKRKITMVRACGKNVGRKNCEESV